MTILTVPKTKFKPKALAYLRRVTAGDRILITDRGRPVVDVIPHAAEEEQALQELRGLLRRYEDPTRPVDEDWEAER